MTQEEGQNKQDKFEFTPEGEVIGYTAFSVDTFGALILTIVEAEHFLDRQCDLRIFFPVGTDRNRS